MQVDSYVHTPPGGEQKGGLLLKQAGRAEGVASWNPHAAFGNSLQGFGGKRRATEVLAGPEGRVPFGPAALGASRGGKRLLTST